MPDSAQKSIFWTLCDQLRWFLPSLLGLLTLVNIVRPIHAQTSASAHLSPPSTDEFPRITTYLDVQDSQGFVHGLQAGEVYIRENGRQLPVNELSEIHPGVLLVTAVSPGPSFAIRDALGNSRYSYLVEALRTWSGILAQSPPDDFSLIAAGFPEVLHFSSPRDWFTAFNSYQPEASSAKPTLDTLARALDVAGGDSPRAGMGHAVLFITAPQDAETTANLQDLADRAVQGGIHVYVWLVAAPESFTTQSAIQLQNLANQTGGQSFSFSGVETVPDLEAILKPLRNAYAISYDSEITISGMHQLIAEINTADLQISTPSRSFELKVLPPNPIFVSLPVSIVRAKPEGENGQRLITTEVQKTDLAPVAQSLEVLIEFPDGYPRLPTRSALYVDGILEDENTTPPFGEFTWDLRQYVQSGKHLLRVEVVDSLGLTGTSIDMGVHIIVEQPRRNFLSLLLSWKNALLAGLVVLSAGLLAILLLVLGGRLRPRWAGEDMRPVPRKLPAHRGSSNNPARPAVRPVEETRTQRIPNWLSHLQLHPRRPAPKAPAFLVPISEAEDMPPVAPIPITANVVIFGRDSVRATLVLDDFSVEEIHARLQRENNIFRLTDAGSIAGTWVNYTPISQDGTILENGDFIHIGRVGFRFTQRDPGHVRKPVVLSLPVEPEART
jgi:pSer/pThr/pTyr-binding forkhead associated (FHA) protein